MAGAEVVEGDAEPLVRVVADELLETRVVDDRLLLGDLDDEGVLVEAELAEQVEGEPLEEALVAEDLRADVEEEAHLALLGGKGRDAVQRGRPAGALQIPELPGVAGMLEHPLRRFERRGAARQHLIAER